MKCKQCTYSQEQAVDCLQTSFLDTHQSLPLNGNLMLAKSLENEQKMDGFPDCKCGREMSDCSIHPNTRDKWIASMQDSLAKILAQQEIKQGLEKVQEVISTKKYYESQVLFDQNTSSWRMLQPSLLSQKITSKLSAKTSLRLGMMLSGQLYLLPKLELTIKGTDGGCLPTPQATDYIIKRTSAKWKAKGAINYCLSNPEIQKMWPTPRANSAMAATITPESAWDKTRFPNLETVVGRELWPTPTAHNAKEGGYPAEHTRNTPTLASPVGGKLNPKWVEWLMGFPLEYSVSKHWETGKFHCKQQSRGKSLKN